MAFDLQEQEQIDALKAFWQRWGTTVTAVIVAALLGVTGVQGWRWYQQRQAESAAALWRSVAAFTCPWRCRSGWRSCWASWCRWRL